ncbi:hypothetical protein BC939DRAFT_440546 [Gamsiella multidivaricata]|uniref:uncharacterized protein n=1 Tax=Gamsiella multidivaricata TaxID=101098 RepID=UPI00221EB18B|nr:uncharacterized protein BC939DRAFT_440546 [Gamsiella multidivaricata]KAI7829772.1 hypothetical protein BC939DRAFT_440546 [Gamsiella multidivaricata]
MPVVLAWHITLFALTECSFAMRLSCVVLIPSLSFFGQRRDSKTFHGRLVLQGSIVYVSPWGTYSGGNVTMVKNKTNKRKRAIEREREGVMEEEGKGRTLERMADRFIVYQAPKSYRKVDGDAVWVNRLRGVHHFSPSTTYSTCTL